MTERNNPFDVRYEPTREDVLIGRVTDGEASPSDWGELEAIARTDAAVWQRLAQSQRAHARLERAVEDAIAIAELVEIPEPPSVIASFKDRWQQWGGWAVAAAVAIAWFGAHNTPLGRSAPSGPAIAGLGQNTAASSDDALKKYLDRGRTDGRVMREMPLQMVDSRDTESGLHVVYYIRPILERAEVKDLKFMRVIQDEHGESRYIPDASAEAPLNLKPM